MRPTLAVGAALLALWAAPALKAANPIQSENALPGTPGWASLRPTADVEAYTDRASVAPGETLALHVAGDPGVAPRYRIEIYRLGWYGGAGGRRVACRPACEADREVGRRAEAPPPDWQTGETRAAWPVTDTIAVPPDWVSGYYEARVVVTAGERAGQAYPVYFVVREPALRRSAILVQVPVNTWQAYNNWGGKSLYGFNSTAGVRASHVSFDRPYVLPPMPGAQATPLAWEVQLVRFLEREGYDVSYQTDVDTDREPESLLRHRLVMTAGHGEYWTKAMRDAFDGARDLGTNLAFVGANNAYWQVRYENARRTMVGYKSFADPEPNPALKTVLFRDVGRPECALMGVMHMESMGRTDYLVDPAALGDPWFASTGFTAGSTLPGLVGLEWDALPGVPPAECMHVGLTVLFRHDGPPGNAHAVRFTAASGARVFASGTMQWSWALDDFGRLEHGAEPADPRVQRFMRNALADLLTPAPPTSLTAVARRGEVALTATARQDPRVRELVVVRHEGAEPFDPSAAAVVCTTASCVDDAVSGHRTYRYAALVRDQWAASEPVFSEPVAVPNTPPSVQLRGPAAARAGARIAFRAGATDADGDALSYRWRVDATPRPERGARLVVRLREPGTHRVAVLVDDGHGGVRSARTVVRVRGR